MLQGVEQLMLGCCLLLRHFKRDYRNRGSETKREKKVDIIYHYLSL